MVKDAKTTRDVFLNRLRQDEGFRARLDEDPRATLVTSFGPLRDDFDIKVVQDSAEVMYLHIPAAPSEGEVLDSDLSVASGGTSFPTTFDCFTRSLMPVL